jgi:hypothetical protein
MGNKSSIPEQTPNQNVTSTQEQTPNQPLKENVTSTPKQTPNQNKPSTQEQTPNQPLKENVTSTPKQTPNQNKPSDSTSIYLGARLNSTYILTDKGSNEVDNEPKHVTVIFIHQPVHPWYGPGEITLKNIDNNEEFKINDDNTRYAIVPYTQGGISKIQKKTKNKKQKKKNKKQKTKNKKQKTKKTTNKQTNKQTLIQLGT